MSETPPDTREAIEFPHQGDVAFSALLDALAPESEGAGAGVAPVGADGAQGAPAVQPATGDGAGAGGDREAPAPGGAEAPGGGAGEAGPPAAETEQPPGGAAPGGAAEPAAVGGAAAPAGWAVESATVVPQLGNLSEKLEERLLKSHQQQAFDTVKQEHGRYFEALDKHPRLLVGQSVPAIGKEGSETLRSSEDAREWQEAVKSILVQEIQARAEASMEESKPFVESIHASIDLFKNNPDLIPGTKGFDRELADRFAEMAKPYEVRIDGKLNGYSIPVQPMIDTLRAQRASKTAPPAAVAIPPAAPTAEPPQAGLTSKAGSSAEKEDFSTLFGTIGLPQLKI